MSYTNSIKDTSTHFNQQVTAAPRTAVTPKQRGDAAGTVAGASSTNASDRTQLSSTSTALAQALSGSDVRTEKVAALQQAIGSGSYKVSSADVADKLLQSLLG